MQHSRTYSYDDGQNNGYPIEHIPHQNQFPGGAPPISRGYQQPQSSHYYLQASGSADVTQPDPYFRSMTPMVHSTHRYSTSGQNRYYPQPGGGASSSQMNSTPYAAHSAYYSPYPKEPRSHHSGLHSQSPGGQFIPTPSEIYNNYPPQQISVPQSPPYSSSRYPPPHSIVPSSSPEQRPARISTGRPQTSPIAGSPILASSPSGERFPCERCGKTFSRSHDRKRHHETQHLTSPVIHRCRFCEKEFSRADSLKRHLDNGCDEMP